MREGKLVSSEFTLWKGQGENRNGRFVVNLRKKIKNCPKGGVKMDSIQGVTLELHEVENIMC